MKKSRRCRHFLARRHVSTARIGFLIFQCEMKCIRCEATWTAIHDFL